MTPADDNGSAFGSRLILLCSFVVIGFGLLGLLGWGLDMPVLASIRTGYFPLVPGAAFSFILLGTSILFYTRAPSSRVSRAFSPVAILLVAIISLVHLVNFFKGGLPGMEAAFLNAMRSIGGTLSLSAQMSPVTAINFLLSSLAMALLWWGHKQWAATLASLMFCANFVPIIGYLFGKPIVLGLFGVTVVPLALPAVLAFQCLGAELLVMAGPDNYPLRIFLGPSARATLLRTFLPGTITLILTYGFLTYIVYDYTKIDFALLSVLLALVAALVVGVVVFQIIQVIGGEIDRAAIERERSEMAIKKERDEKQLYLDTAGVMLFALNIHGQITLINKKGCGILGYKEHELLGRNWCEVCLPAAVRDEAKAKFHKLIAGDVGPDEYYEYPVLTKSGAECFLSFHSAVVKDASSRITGILCSGEDIALRKQTDKELRTSFEKLRKFLGITIQIIEQLTERRDLYTSGHQKRVADLSRAIATHMGLPDERIDSVRIAGSIHDIGKITIPAEILNKSSKLSELEFNIIKTHPQVGYDIMNDIEFPWPVSQFILQHHERFDGSGYPQGLKGDEIHLEARIIGVADVVEAITAHRPYRPALGTDQALEEISRNSGTLYDPDTVDACLKLFDGGYKFCM